MGGIDANCVREGASSTPCTLVSARPLRNTLAPMTTRMLLRRGQHRSSHRNPRQQGTRRASKDHTDHHGQHWHHGGTSENRM